jgi:hypothetical protein
MSLLPTKFPISGITTLKIIGAAAMMYIIVDMAIYLKNKPTVGY